MNGLTQEQREEVLRWSAAQFLIADLGRENAARWLIAAAMADLAEQVAAEADDEMARARGLPTSEDQLH